MTRSEVFSRIDDARGEFEAARFCLSRVERDIAAGGALRPADPIKVADLRACAGNLEVTYILRLFAEFEFALRNFLAANRPSPQPRRIRMEHLIDRISANRSIPYDIHQDAHEVREYRNEIVHVADPTSLSIFYDCKSRLAKFLSYLPLEW
jgi:hypothetical protein